MKRQPSRVGRRTILAILASLGMFIGSAAQAEQPKQHTPAPSVKKAKEATGFPPFSNPVSSALDYRGKKAPPLGHPTWLTAVPDTKGKVLIIDFWATWCRPCVKSIPKMNEHAHRFAKDVVIIGLSDEKERVVRKFLKKKKKKMQYSVAVDRRAKMLHALQIRAIPHVVVISPDGVIRFQGHPAYLTDAVIAQIVRASKSLNN